MIINKVLNKIPTSKLSFKLDRQLQGKSPVIRLYSVDVDVYMQQVANSNLLFVCCCVCKTSNIVTLQ